jgi:hypothetical protein
MHGRLALEWLELGRLWFIDVCSKNGAAAAPTMDVSDGMAD